MSEQALNFKMLDTFGNNQRLSAFYDFEVNESTAYGSDEQWTGIFYNSPYAYNTGSHKCFVLGATGVDSSTAESELFYITGATNPKRNLSSGAFLIPLDGLDVKNISTIIDFEFAGQIGDSVLMGCFQTGQETFYDNVEQVSSGFNIGVTDRGHLFCQTLNSNGNSIRVLDDIELSKRNILGCSISKSSIIVSCFDYLNNLVKSLEIPVEQSYISDVNSIYLGGTNSFYRDSPTVSGNLNAFALFSGFLDPVVLKELGEGVLGDYSYTAQSEETFYRVTGYNQTIVYKTGITGYDYEVTGTLTIETGREMFSGSISLDSSVSKEEGESYYKYYTLNNGDITTFYKEELGKLHSNSGYIYYPTGEDAYDTLGLNDISESIQTYVEDTGIKRIGDSISINLYGKNALTGVLNEVSGVVDVALTGDYTVVTPASSGVSMDGNSRDLKKNYIYYMGDRS